MRSLAPPGARFGPWIDGAAVPDDRRPVEPVVAPFDGRELATVEQAQPEDVDRAVRTAVAAQLPHATVPARERADRLRAAAQQLGETSEVLVGTLVDVLGKPRKLSAIEVRRGIELMRLCAEEILRMRGETIPLDAVAGGEGHWGLTWREPFGVVAAITPFNAPVNLLLQKVAPALAMGNAVVIKPAPEASVIALQIAKAISQVLPPGLVNVLPGDAEVGARLVSHPEIRAVSLTGGVAAGEAVLASAGVKPVLLELGSNSANIVCADADLDLAADAVAQAAFSASGQQCISAQRVIVEAPVVEAFTERFVSASRRLVVGDPDDPKTDIGPLVHARRRDHVVRFIEDAEGLGATVLLDGRDADGLLFGPTILRDVLSEALLMRDEVFGPVAVLVEAGSLDEAIGIANTCDLGLQAACFTHSLDSAMRAAERLRAGAVWINESTRFRLDVYPFGGYGRSGIGREGVRYAMEALSQVKFVGLRG